MFTWPLNVSLTQIPVLKKWPIIAYAWHQASDIAGKVAKNKNGVIAPALPRERRGRGKHEAVYDIWVNPLYRAVPESLLTASFYKLLTRTTSHEYPMSICNVFFMTPA